MKSIRGILVVLMLSALVFSMTGCSSESIKIENHDWELTLIQSSKDGSVIGCASEHYEMHKEIEGLIVVDLECSAKNGNFTITDETNNQSYHGNYEESDVISVESTTYSIATTENTGTAVTSITKSDYDIDEGDKIPTLIITIGDYTLNFQAE